MAAADVAHMDRPEPPERQNTADRRRENMEPTERRTHVPSPSTVHVRLSSHRREVQDGTIVSRRMDVESGEERDKAVLNEINDRNLERSVGAWLGSQIKRRGWGRWRAAEALGVRLPRLSAWLDGRADPTEEGTRADHEPVRTRPSLGPAEAHSAGRN